MSPTLRLECSTFDECLFKNGGVYISTPVTWVLLVLFLVAIVVITIYVSIRRRREWDAREKSSKAKYLRRIGGHSMEYLEPESAPPYTPTALPSTPAPELKYPPPSYSPV